MRRCDDRPLLLKVHGLGRLPWTPNSGEALDECHRQIDGLLAEIRARYGEPTQELDDRMIRYPELFGCTYVEVSVPVVMPSAVFLEGGPEAYGLPDFDDGCGGSRVGRCASL